MNVDVAQVEFYPQLEEVSGDEADDVDQLGQKLVAIKERNT